MADSRNRLAVAGGAHLEGGFPKVPRADLACGIDAAKVKETAMWRLCKETLLYLRQEKKWWLIPLVVVLLLLAALMLFSGSSALAPFMYPFM